MEDGNSYLGRFLDEIAPPHGFVATNVTGVHFLVSVLVDEAGGAYDGRIEWARANRDSADIAARELELTPFIPGFVDGAPRTMRTYEILYVGSLR